MDSVSLWRAPLAESPVHATVTLPGSKSITNRALILAAMEWTGQRRTEAAQRLGIGRNTISRKMQELGLD